MTRRSPFVAVILLGLVGGTPQIARAANPGYLTLSFGRTQWVSTQNRVRLPNTVDLGQAATEFRARGLTGARGIRRRR